MENTSFLPEICYQYKSLTLEDIFIAYADKQSVTGYVESLIEAEQKVVVRLGHDIIAHMPYVESTMYPLRKSDSLFSSIPTNVYSLVGKNIRVKIIRLNGKFITVSRKASMLEAFEHLCNCKQSNFHVTSIARKCAFGDVGAGIIGRVIIDEICRTHIKSIREYLKKGDVIPVCILARNADNYFDLSYKLACAPYIMSDYYVGMTVVGKVCDFVHGAQRPGFYVNIAPQVSGIMNVSNVHRKLKYGTKVQCFVTGISNSGLHLQFSKILD